MKKRVFVISLVIFLLLGGSIFCIRCNTGLKSVVVNDAEFNSATIEEDYLNYIKEVYKVFDTDELNEFVSYTIDLSEITNRSFIDKFVDYIKSKSYTISYTYTFDKDGIKKYLKEYNKSATKSEDAYIKKGKKSFSIVKEVYGDKIDIDKLLSSLKCDYKEIKLSDYFIKPAVLEADLYDKANELNNYANWFCEYSNGNKISSCIDYVTYENGKVVLNTDWISEVIYDAIKSYNTVGNARDFVTHDGKSIKVSGGTWGNYIDKDSEVEFLIDAFENGKCITDREPIYKLEMDEIGDTYIEVSIEDQHVWVYQYGELVMDSPCVTGNARLKHNTPTGLYYISECINGKYLTGDNYKTWVNKWMRLTYTGIGLHDAYWRGSFGGSIYKTNGSHGCINLPKSFAYNLYGIAYTGMPVVIY